METCSVKISPTFGSNKIIRDADKVCRIIAKEFPAISGTRVETMKFANENDRFINYYKKKQFQNKVIRDDAWKLFTPAEPLYFYQRFIKNMKNYKNINCADYTKLAELILAANGIKTVKARILTQNLKQLDHAVLVANPPGSNFLVYKNKDLKNMIIIDPWLGFADYAHNAIIKYNSEYAKFLALGNKYVKLLFTSEQNPKITQSTIDYLKCNFPQFIQKKDFMKM